MTVSNSCAISLPGVAPVTGGDAHAWNVPDGAALEPPTLIVPLTPVRPDRPKLIAGVLGLALAAGVGLAVLVGLLRPAVYVREDFADIAAFPVYGVVSRVWTPRLRFKRRLELATFGLGCSALVSLGIGLIVLQNLNVDLVAKVKTLAERLL